MKQHITPEQLNELSEKNFKRIQLWWMGKDYTTDGTHGDFLPLLSIGQMIEFLEENDFIKDYKHRDILSIHIGGSDVEGQTWNYHSHSYTKKYKHQRRQIKTEELCDCLWEAVREILEKGGK